MGLLSNGRLRVNPERVYFSHMRGRRWELTKDILLTVAATGGFMLIAMAAPGALRIFAPLIKKYRRGAFTPAHFRHKLHCLHDQGLINISETGGKTRISLTKAGRTRILEYEVDTMEIPKRVPWDGQWRFVIFDIPEKKKLARNVFREKLRALGFVKVQQSVWRHKYPCQSQIEFLVRLYQIHRYVDLVEGKQTL